ncbi:MAG: LytR C-terminal domain-containing protein [Actinobacteria bacterium]|nr:LytR C-terminal domain-containing protein [Actinomycetota bacterium]
MNSIKKRSIISKKVPYSEKRTVKKYLVPRVVQLKRRRAKERFLFFASFLAFLLLIYSISYLNVNFKVARTASPTPTEKPLVQNENKAQDSLDKSPFFVYAQEKGKISTSAICAYDKRLKSLAIILIDKSIYVPVLGLGVIDAKSLSTKFLPEYIASIKNFFEFELKGPYVVNSQSLDTNRLRQSPNTLISELLKLNSLKIDKISSVKSVEIVPAPTRLSRVANGTVVVLDASKLNEAASIMFSDNFPKRNPKGTVIILNGSGLPASGAQAAVILINAGYRVNAIRNAERFDYLVTEIQSSEETIASEIQALLKCGEKKVLKGAEGVADAVIVIGRDFSTNN